MVSKELHNTSYGTTSEPSEKAKVSATGRLVLGAGSGGQPAFLLFWLIFVPFKLLLVVRSLGGKRSSQEATYCVRTEVPF